MPMWIVQFDAVVSKLSGTQNVNCRSRIHHDHKRLKQSTYVCVDLSTLSGFKAFNAASINSPDCKPMWQMRFVAVINKLTGTQNVNCRSQAHGRETSNVNWTS